MDFLLPRMHIPFQIGSVYSWSKDICFSMETDHNKVPIGEVMHSSVGTLVFMSSHCLQHDDTMEHWFFSALLPPGFGIDYLV